MFKWIIAALIITSANSNTPVVTEEMIFESVENALKNGIRGIGNLGDFFVKKHAKGEKSFNWYYNENNKMRKELEKRKIDHWTILKQHMYPMKISNYSKEAEIKKYIILKTLCKQNNIIKSEPVTKDKKKINIITTDIYKLKKN